MKYILIEYTQGDAVYHMPFVFPNNFVHAKMYEQMKYAIREETIDNKRHNGGQFAHDFKCVAAGEVSSTYLKGFHGESQTLGVKSRNEVDDNVIGMCDYTHGLGHG